MELFGLTLRNFRNYENLSLKLKPGVHILLGENGAGKTNLLEALEIVSALRSHRTRNDADIIRKDEREAFVEAEYERYEVKSSVSVTLQRRRGRVMRIGSGKAAVSEIIGNIKTVLFSPDDLMLAKGAPSLRRSFIDREICQASRIYLDNLMRYNGVLKERNALLKRIKEGLSNSDILEIYDAELAKYASLIVKKRIETVKELSDTAAKTVSELSGERENFEIIYSQEFSETIDEKDFLKLLKENYNKDIQRGFTGIGPHIDDLTFKMNGMSLKNFASQGQQRTAVLATKLSEVTFLKEQTDEYPILLLDDVLSELDENRRIKLLDFVDKKGITTFLTATDNSYIPENIGIRHYVNNGKIT